MDRYLRLLTFLAVRGIEIATDISDEMYAMFERQPDLPANQAREGVNQDILSFLRQMRVNAHIRFEQTGFRNDITWRETLIIVAWLTPVGFEYLSQQNLIISNREVNAASVRNFQAQEINERTTNTLTRSALTIAGLSVIVSIITLITTCTKKDDTALSIDRLRREIIEKQTSPHKTTSPQASPAQASHKP